jgi:FMN phosphatase YigB (HAD superfamily)
MRSILFDFGGTLDSDGRTWLERFFLLYREAGVAGDRAAFDKAFYKSDDELPTRYNLARMGFQETVELQVAGVLETLAPSRANLKGRIAGGFLADCRKHFTRNRAILERLREKYKIGIVSNYYGNLDACLKAEGLRDLFDVVADSGVVGTTKPDAGIFEHALKALGSTAAEAVMVGDSIKRDMRGAEGLKMTHALLAQADSCCDAAWRLETLADLEGRLS